MINNTEITPEFREQLKQFCIELNAWIEAGCPKHPFFRTNQGICWNYIAWTLIPEYTSPSNSPIVAAVGGMYPFGDSDVFQLEQERRTLYQNPARLAWIKEHMK